MKRFLTACCAVFLLFGCSYQSQRTILKERDVGNSQTFDASSGAVYDAFLKSALLKNFIIKEENDSAKSVSAERSVEKGKRTYIVVIQARIFDEGPGKSKLFLNGSERCERTYVRDNTRFFLFIIPLPGGGGKEASTIMESVKPIRDKYFYNDFFRLVKSNIIQKSEPEKMEAVSDVAVEEPAKEEPVVQISVQDQIADQQSDALQELQDADETVSGDMNDIVPLEKGEL